MKSILVMLSQSPLAGQPLLESLSAVMVLATYGVRVQIMLTGDAIGLLRAAPSPDLEAQPRPFKSAFALVESFEFYDLLPVWVAQHDSRTDEQILQSTETPYVMMEMTPETLSHFDGVLRW